MNSDLVSREAAAKAVCLFCAVPEFYGPPKEIEGSKRLWHSDLRNSNQGVVQCSAASIIAFPAAHPRATSSTEAQKRCLLCAHYGNVDKGGTCRELGTYPVQGGESRAEHCGCVCVFSAGAETSLHGPIERAARQIAAALERCEVPHHVEEAERFIAAVIVKEMNEHG